MTVLESLPVLGDLLKMELDFKYCRDAGQFPASSPIDGKLPESLLGYPVAIAANGNCVPVIATAEGTTTGLLLIQKKLTATDTGQSIGGFPVLTRGPAIVNRNALPTVDYDGDNLDLDDIVAQLDALGIKVIEEHDEKTIQTLN